MKWLLRNALPGNVFGFQAPEISDLNEEDCSIDMSEGEGDVDIFSADELFPSQIELRLKLSPVPYEREDFRQIFLQVEGESYGSQRVYDVPIEKPITGLNYSAKEAHYKAIDLLDTGQGSYTYQGESKYFVSGHKTPFLILPPEKGRLYRKHFGRIQKRWQVIDFELKKRFLIPYGGLYYPGIPIESIQQVYCETICSQDESFTLGFTPYNLWRKREVTPPHSGAFEGNEIHFVGDCPKSAHLTLTAALIAGEAQFVVQHQEISESRVYVSRSYKLPGNHPDFIDVTFIQNGFNF